MSTDDNHNIAQVLVRVLCDTRTTEVADAIYVFAQTEDNEPSVLRAARHAVESRLVDEIVLLDEGKTSGYAGYKKWTEDLVRSGVKRSLISGAKLQHHDLHNTLTEALAYIRYSKEKRHKQVYVCAPPFHQLRAFMTTIRAAQQELPFLKINSYPGLSQPWREKVIHSQGILAAKRNELISSELERITKYYKKGDLISFEQTIEYLNARDE